MEETPIELGTKVKDTVTGATGKVTGIFDSITGKKRAEVSALDNAGRPFETWFDIERLEVVPA